MNSTNVSLRQVLTLGVMLMLVLGWSWAADDQSDIAKRLAASAKVLDDVMATPNKSIPKGVIQRACLSLTSLPVRPRLRAAASHSWAP